jgi:DNA invertase Pin-like site-specific DNA recombinase
MATSFKVKRNPNAPTRFVGYARVSTEEQSLSLQVDALKRAGVLDDDIHVEKVSGAASKRPMLDWALGTLRPGDTFVVWKMDRVARSLADLLRRIKLIEDAGAGFKSLTESIDTTTAGGRLIMHVMGAIAEFERDLIRERTKAGVKAAQQRGVRIGQPEALSPRQKAEAQKMRNRKVPVRQIAKKFKVCTGTIYNHTLDPALLRKAR